MSPLNEASDQVPLLSLNSIVVVFMSLVCCVLCWLMTSVQCIDFALQVIRLKNPARAVAFPAIFNSAKFADGGFGGEIYGEMIARVTVHIVVDALEVFGGQF